MSQASNQASGSASMSGTGVTLRKGALQSGHAPLTAPPEEEEDARESDQGSEHCRAHSWAQEAWKKWWQVRRPAASRNTAAGCAQSGSKHTAHSACLSASAS